MTVTLLCRRLACHMTPCHGELGRDPPSGGECQTTVTDATEHRQLSQSVRLNRPVVSMQEELSALPQAPRKTVLIVIGEPTVRDLVAVNLRYAGFYPVLAPSARDGRRLVGQVVPDVILIDIDAQDTCDLSFASELAKVDSMRRVPTVMVTANVSRQCGVQREVCGASLCVGKPFSPRDLVGSITRQLRAPKGLPSRRPASAGSLQVGRVELDGTSHVVAVHHHDGEVRRLVLPLTELKLLQCLMSAPGKLHAREQILEAVWGAETLVDVRTVDQNVRRLRARLAELGAGDFVKTVRGYGYRLDARGICASARADTVAQLL